MALRALPDGYSELANGDISLLVRDDHRDALVAAGMLEGVAPTALGEVVARLGGGRGEIPVVRLAGLAAPLVVKTERRGGVLGRFLGAATSGHRAFRRLLHNASIRAAGVGSPAIVAVRVTRLAIPGLARVETVTPLLDGAIDLERFLRESGGDAARRAVISAAGRAVGALHRAGLVHPDLNVRNVLVSPDRTVHLIDVGVARPASASAETAELARLARSALKRGLIPRIVSRADCARFLRGVSGDRWRGSFGAASDTLVRTLPLHRIAWRIFG